MAFNLLAALLAVSPSGTAQGSHLLDQLHLLECSRQVILVAKHQDRNASEGRLAEQFMQLVPRLLQGLRVSRINDIPAPPTILSVCCSRAGCSQRILWQQSTTHTIALTPRQYRSHIPRKRGWPPRSQNLIVTFPLFTLRMLKPTVGIVSSVNSPTCREIKPSSGT
jgi:hypothetical protein